MLTLIKGKARKSEYMQLLHKGTNNSVMVLYGHDIPVLMPEGKEVMSFPRSAKTQNDLNELEFELLELMAQILGNTDYRYVYLYGNSSLSEVDVISKVANNQNVKPKLSIVATVQDASVPNGQIVIEELR